MSDALPGQVSRHGGVMKHRQRVLSAQLSDKRRSSDPLTGGTRKIEALIAAQTTQRAD